MASTATNCTTLILNSFSSFHSLQLPVLQVAIILLISAAASAATTTTAGCSVVDAVNSAADEAQAYLNAAKKQLGSYSQYLPDR